MSEMGSHNMWFVDKDRSFDYIHNDYDDEPEDYLVAIRNNVDSSTYTGCYQILSSDRRFLGDDYA